MLVNKLGIDVLLLMLCKLRFCKSFQSDNYIYRDLNNSTLDFFIYFYRNRFLNSEPKVAKMVCQGREYDAVFLPSVCTRLT